MANYEIRLVAERHVSAVVIVSAANMEQAQEKAVDMAGDLDWCDNDGLQDVRVVDAGRVSSRY